MELVYRTFGLSGGKWQSSIFSKNKSAIDYTENHYEHLGGVSDVVEKDLSRLMGILESTDATIDFYTDVREDESDQLEEITSIDHVKNTYPGYRPQLFDKTSDLWSVSTYLCEHDLYDFDLTKTPEPPYTVYTDASYWPDLEQGSIGFVVEGENKGVYAVGCPIVKPLIPDNNIAEFYAALASFESLEDDTSVQVLTDSTNLASILREEREEHKSKTTDFLVEASKRFSDISVQTTDRKQVSISDTLADIGKYNPLVFGSEPRTK